MMPVHPSPCREHQSATSLNLPNLFSVPAPLHPAFPCPQTRVGNKHGAQGTANLPLVGLMLWTPRKVLTTPLPTASQRFALAGPFIKHPWDFHELFILNNLEQASGPQCDVCVSNFRELLRRAHSNQLVVSLDSKGLENVLFAIT